MKTSFSRTFSILVVVLLLALFVVDISFQALAKDYLTDSTVSELKENSTALAELASAYHMEGSFVTREFLVNLDVASRISGADAVICNAAGQIIICSNSLSGCGHQGLTVDEEYLQKVIENGGDVATGTIPELYDESRYIVTTPISDFVTGDNLGMVIVSRPTEATDAVLGRISEILMTVSILSVLLAAIVVFLPLRHMNAPLKQMASVARAFGHGDLEARVKLTEDYPEEVEDLAFAFNNMAQELQKSEYQRKEFVANVSHELKTPMTTIAGYVDGILDGTIPAQRHRYYLQIVSDETKRLSRLVRSMLDISKLQDQGGVPEEKKIHFDMEECAGMVLVTFEQKINAKGIYVDVDMPAHPVYTHACEDYITQVIYNLIDNAVKFCPEGGTIGLKISEGGGKVYVTVSNDGDTIPAEELPLVFDRFHKLDKSRSQNRDGWGLGLYIVKTMVCSHGENISVSSRDGRTEFTFTMPLVN